MKRTAKQVALGALAAALIMVATALIKVTNPFTLTGYYHLGDGVIFVMAMLLGARNGALAAGAGSMLADLMAGFGIYAPATFVIKAAMGYVAGKAAGGNMLRRLLVFSLCEAIMVAGYFAFETVVYGLGVAFANVSFNLIQSAFGIVLGVALTGGWMQRFAKSLEVQSSDGKQA
jgi:uncharacterized membrane protein